MRNIERFCSYEYISVVVAIADLKEFSKVSNKTIEIDGCLNKWTPANDGCIMKVTGKGTGKGKGKGRGIERRTGESFK